LELLASASKRFNEDVPGASPPMTKITSCPICRGEIHAIAGRCKHCKADLVELRERAARAARAQAIGATVPPPRGFGFFPSPPPSRSITQPLPALPVPTAIEPEMEPARADAFDQTLADAGPAVELPPPELAPVPPLRAPHPFVQAPPEGTPPFGLGFAGARPRRASSWSRRWPLVVSAVALLAIGISIGVLAERWRQGQTRSDARRASPVSRSPVMVPDHMPQPLMPGPAPRVAPDRDAKTRPRPRAQAPDPPSVPDRAQDEDESEPPADPPDPPGQPGSRFSAPPSSGDASDFRTFSASLTDSLCQKLSQCGLIDSATQSMCREFARGLDPDDAAEKVARGECSFNRKAADACLRAVADLRCDMGPSDRMMEWLMAPNRVGECAEAYVCP
jgi:hypothetical protein